MTTSDEANIVLAGLLDGANHADCESCRDTMRRAHALLTDGRGLARLAIEQGALIPDGSYWSANDTTRDGVFYEDEALPDDAKPLYRVVEP